jgi:dihydrodipicolinate synthase/N-acetylneuraminate lyase
MLGGTGEGAWLSVSKRKQWAEAVLAAAKGKLPIYVHVGYNENLDDSVELAAHAAKNGASAVSSVGISERASLDENVAYFKRISDAAPELPFYIYWVSMGKTLTAGKSIPAEELLNAMDAVPTFAGIKFTDSNFYLLERFKKYRADINILTGFDELAVCSMLMGADGNIGLLQGVTCYHFKVMYEKFREGSIKEARDLQYRANELAEFYSRPEIGNLPGIKALMDRIYGIPAGYPSLNGPYGAKLPEKSAVDALVDVFHKNILTVTGK